MAITQIANYTPTDRRPQAFSLSSPAALEINNQTTMRLVVMVSRTLQDVLYPGDHKVYAGLNNLSVAPTWVLLSPDDVPDSGLLSGFLSVTTYGASDALPAQGSYSPGSFSTPNLQAQNRQMLIRGLAYFDVKSDFGAVGDGFTNDQAAIQAAYDAARVLGGARVHHPAGVYNLMPIATNGASGTLPAALAGGSNCAFTGDGAGATVLKMAANAPNQSYVWHNYTNTAGGGDADILLSGLTIDGNAANQAATSDAQYGVRFFKCRRVRVEACTFKDVYGTTSGALGSNGTAGEGFAQRFDQCADCSVVDSVAYATAANTSSGFASNQSTNVQRVNCVAYGWAFSMGFTDFQSQNVQHTNCRSYLNGSRGFNLEQSLSAIYTGCIAGGLATATGAYPFGNAASLGNTGSGFSSSGSSQVQYIGCDSANNGQHGLQHFGAGAGRCFVVGGNYSANTGSGIFLDSNATKQLCIAGPIRFSGNGTVISTGGTPATASSTGLQSAPGSLSSGVAFTNPFPYPVLVRVSGGTVSAIAVDGNATGDTAGWFRVEFAGTITVTFTVAPSVTWWAAL